jgi:hypothetical protein
LFEAHGNGYLTLGGGLEMFGVAFIVQILEISDWRMIFDYFLLCGTELCNAVGTEGTEGPEGA